MKLRVIAPMQIVTRGGKPDDRTLVSITATNVGSKETVINLLAMAYWPSFLHMMLDKKRRDMVVPDPTIPGSIYVIPFDLGVGKQWTGAIDYKDEIREMANKGRLYFRVYHTLASKPATARIRDSFATKEAKPS